VRTRESRPAGAAPETAAKQSEASIPCPYDRRPRPTFNLGRVLERRRASRELDTILGVRGYPDIGVTYGLRSVEASERDVLRSLIGGVRCAELLPRPEVAQPWPVEATP